MGTPHITRVAIANRSNKPIHDVCVVHVFGDQTPEVLAWNETFESTKTSRSITKNVTYATGLGSMTNYDWWLVSWKIKAKSIPVPQLHPYSIWRVITSSCKVTEILKQSSIPPTLSSRAHRQKT